MNRPILIYLLVLTAKQLLTMEFYPADSRIRAICDIDLNDAEVQSNCAKLEYYLTKVNVAANPQLHEEKAKQLEEQIASNEKQQRHLRHEIEQKCEFRDLTQKEIIEEEKKIAHIDKKNYAGPVPISIPIGITTKEHIDFFEIKEKENQLLKLQGVNYRLRAALTKHTPNPEVSANFPLDQKYDPKGKFCAIWEFNHYFEKLRKHPWVQDRDAEIRHLEQAFENARANSPRGFLANAHCCMRDRMTKIYYYGSY